MKTFIFCFISLSIFILFLSCEDNNIIDGNSDLAKVNVDLQFGFDNYFVRVKFNEENYFSADLTELVPLSGPLATFITYLPPGKNSCEVFWQENYGQVGQPYFIDSANVIIGDLEEYYLGIRAVNDSIEVELRNTPFGYM